MPNGIVAFLASGWNTVSISGQGVILGSNAVSGNIVQARIYDASTGQFANIFVTNNDAVSTANFALQSQALLYGFHPTNNAWGRVGITSPVSGDGYRILAAISGQTVNASVNVTTNISGQPVQISGQTVNVVGTISASSNVSGNVVYLASGQNASQISGQSVSIIGTVPVTGSFSANVSGNTVWLTSGKNDVQISGQTVSIAGGINTSISGQPILISGQTVSIAGSISTSSNVSGQVIYLVSGNNAVQFSGQTLNAFTYGFDPTTGLWRANQITTSGDGGKLIVSVSGQPVAISGQTVSIAGGINTSISGQPLLVSGQLVISKISGESVSILGTVPVSLASLPTISVSGNVVRISGETVSIAGSINTSSNISGQIVYLTSGKNDVQISGQTVQIAGGINTSISGQPVLISGQTVSIAGSISTTAGVSGQTVYLASGQNNVQISGQSINILGTVPVSIAAILPVTTNVSGNAVRISGETILSKISGETIRLVNDGINNVVQISGQTIQGSFSANISGNVVYLTSGRNTILNSGQTFYLPNDGINNMVGLVQPARITITNPFTGNDTLPAQYGNADVQATTAYTIPVTAQLLGYDKVTDTYSRVRVTASGDGFRLITSVSGQPVSISGQTVSIGGSISTTSNVSGQIVYLTSGFNAVQISGQSVNILGTVPVSVAAVLPVSTNVSGNVVYLVSGQNAVQISGQTVSIAGSINVTSNVSGNIVYLTSGQNTVQMSGQTVSIAGTVPVSVAAVLPVTTSISGNTVYLASGQNSVQISGQSVSVIGTVPVSLASIIAAISGQTVISKVSGESVSIIGTVPVTGSFSANVSGNIVYLTSGQNIVQFSGQTVRLTDAFGTPIRTIVNGPAWTDVVAVGTLSGSVTQISGQIVRLTDFGGGSILTNLTTNGWQGALTVASLSGSVTQISGQTVVAQNSGQMVRLSDANGAGINRLVNDASWLGALSVGTVSGSVTKISGQSVYLVSGNNGVQTSGQTINAFMYGFDSTTGLWRANPITISGDGGRPVVAMASGTNEVMLSAAPTYYAVANNIIPLSGRHAMSIFLASGTPVIKVKGLFMTNNEPALISGQHLRWDINQINLAPQSGLGISPLRVDPRDPASGHPLIVMANPFGSVSGVLLFPYITTTQGTHGIRAAITSGVSTTMLQAHVLQSVNLIPQSPEVKEINITSGYGISVQQTTVSGYTQVTSGQFSILMVYTLNM